MSSWYYSEGFLPLSQGSMAEFGGSELWGDLPDSADQTIATQPWKMSDTRRIHETEWEAHKEEIKALYLTQNKTRGEVMAAMERLMGFKPGKLDQWGFKKNSTDEKWKFIARTLEKRELDGKESDTYINGKLVPRKRVKKEVSRHCLPSWQATAMTAPSPPPPGGIEIRTPPREHAFFIDYLHIPWLEFETLVDPQIQRLRALAHGRDTTRSLVYSQPVERPDNLLNSASTPRLAIATNQRQRQRTVRSEGLENDQRAPVLNQSYRVREQAPVPTLPPTRDQEARSLFAYILGQPINPDSNDYLSKITSHLDDILIERQDGDITKNVQKFFGPSIFEISLQLLRYSIYLSSNDLLSDDRTDKILQWIVQSGQFAAIEHLIKLKRATTEIFASNLLLSVVRLKDVTSLRALVDLGVDVNIPGGSCPKKTALWMAATTLRDKRVFMDPIQPDFSIVRLLLDVGADIDAKSGYGKTSPLQEAISEENVELVEILLNAKAPVGPPKQTSMITRLQDAASRHDTDTVQSLLDAGADFDAQAEVPYEAARKTAVESNLFHRLQSPIQIAASQGETEMVQVFLEAGANVDGYFFAVEELSAYQSTDTEIVAKEEEAKNHDDDDEYDDYCSEEQESDDDDCFERSSSYRTPLQFAVAHGNTVLVRVLLLAGANVEGLGLGPTPLQLAAFENDVKLVKLMLRNGAAVNTPPHGFNGSTALQAAVGRGNLDLVDILMDAGADLNAPASSKFGRTILQAAVRAKSLELVSRLISLGADINAAASPVKGRTCLQAAAENGHSELVKFFFKAGAEVNAAPAAKCGFTALQAAAKGNHLSVVKMLLDAGADVHAPSTEGGYSALYAAVKRNNLEMVQLLLKKANPNGQADRVPPLLEASRKGSTEIVQCLLQAGANINAARSDKPTWVSARTALEAALEAGCNNVFYILFNAGADVNGQTLTLGAALGAALSGWYNPINMDIIRKLLDAGADVNRAFSSTEMPLHDAVASGWLDLVQLLLDAGADVNGRTLHGDTALREAVYQGNIDIIQFLLNAGANINAPAAPERGRTALQAAAECNNASLVRFLLEQGADCNAPAAPERGRTALQVAAEDGNVSLARFLLEQGADCNSPAADSKGVTALQAAAIIGNLPIALMLLKAGADINGPAAKTDGRTALEGAAEHGRLDIVSLLLKNDTETEGMGIRNERAANLAESNGHIFISKTIREYKGQ